MIELNVTGAAMAAGLGLVVAGAIMERRPRTSLTPRLIPTTPMMFAGVIVAVLALLHLMTLMGNSGRP